MRRPVGQKFLAGTQREHVAGARRKLDAVNRLGQKVVGASEQGLVTHFFLIIRRHHQDRNFIAAMQGAEGADEFQAIHIGHHVIDNNQIRHMLAAPVEGAQRVVEKDRRTLTQLEHQSLDQGQVDITVINNQDRIHERSQRLNG